MRKSIVFILILMVTFLQGWTYTDSTGGLIRSAHAETKQSGTKSTQKAATKKGEGTSKKERLAPPPVLLESLNYTEAQRKFKIAFIKDETVWIMNADGSNQNRLTEPNIKATSPRWSPDGNKIAFVDINKENEHFLYVMKNDGTDLQQIGELEGPYYGANMNLQWSVDGETIHVFISYMDGGGRHYLISKHGDVLSTSFEEIYEKFKPFESIRNFKIDFKDASPDGKKKLFSQKKGKYIELFVSDIDGKNMIQLSNNTATKKYDDCWGDPCDTNGMWTPDGKRILYIPYETCGDSCYGKLYVVDENGKNRKLLDDVSEFPKTWSPDGNIILIGNPTAKKTMICATNFISTKCLTEGYSPDWMPVSE